MYYGAGGSLRAQSPPRRGGTDSSTGLRIQRRTTNTVDAPVGFRGSKELGPPVTKPPPTDDKYQSLSRTPRIPDGESQKSLGSTSFPSPSSGESSSHSSNTNQRSMTAISRESKEASLELPSEQKEEQEHRDSYVEEPLSPDGTLHRSKSSALVRRVTNEMALTHYVHKVEINPEGAAGSSPGVYRIKALRWPELGMRKVFWHLGKSIANHSNWYTFLSICLVVPCFLIPFFYRETLGIGLPFSTLLPVNDFDVTSSGVGIRRPVVPQFNSTNPAYSAVDRLNLFSYAILMKNKDAKDSILRDETIAEYSNVKHMIESIGFGGKTWNDFCGSDCSGGEAAIVDKIIRKSSLVSLTYPETYVSLSRDDANLTRLYLASSIGGVELDLDSAITSAQSLLKTYKLNKQMSREETALWERHFVSQIDTTTTNPSNPLELLRWSYADFADTVVEALRRCHDWVGLGICAAVLIGCCLISTMAANAYQTKPIVGLASAVVVCVSCGAALSVSITTTTGTSSLNPLIFPTLFVIVGIGSAFCVSVHGSWAKYSSAALHPTEKIALILAYEGTFVTATSLVLIAMFLSAGLTSATPFMTTAFLTVAAGVAALLLLTLLLLTVFVHKEGRREAKGCKWFHCGRTGDNHFPSPNLTDFDNSSLESLHERLIDNKPSPSRQLAAWLVRPSLRYPLVVICTLYLIFAVWGCVNVTIDLREEHFLPSQSHARRFLESFREMFGKTEEYLEITIEQSLDYHDPVIREHIIDLIEGPVKDQFASRSVNWLADFGRFEKNSIYDINQDTFVPVVTLVFLKTDPYQRYSSDITFDRFQTTITRTRMYLELTQKGVRQRVKLIDAILSKARSLQLPITVKAPFVFSIEHDLQALSTTLFAFGIFLIALLGCTLVIFGQPMLTFVVVLTSFLILCETIGYASHWGVPLNTITFTMAICANAVSCVVALSFCYSYSTSGKGLRTVQRVQYTFQSCLVSLVLACSLPVLTYVPLLSIDAPVIMHIWRILLLNALASFIHFMIFLPNLFPLFCENASTACTSLFSGGDDDSSIYYIPTAGRIMPAEGIYQHAEYAYTMPKIAPPPSYLAIGPAETCAYGRYEPAAYGRTRRNSTAESSTNGTPQVSREHHGRRMSRESEGIYEAPPSPRVRSAHSPQAKVHSSNRERRQERLEMSSNWRQMLNNSNYPNQSPIQSQPYSSRGYFQ